MQYTCTYTYTHTLLAKAGRICLAAGNLAAGQNPGRSPQLDSLDGGRGPVLIIWAILLGLHCSGPIWSLLPLAPLVHGCQGSGHPWSILRRRWADHDLASTLLDIVPGSLDLHDGLVGQPGQDLLGGLAVLDDRLREANCWATRLWLGSRLLALGALEAEHVLPASEHRWEDLERAGCRLVPAGYEQGQAGASWPKPEWLRRRAHGKLRTSLELYYC